MAYQAVEWDAEGMPFKNEPGWIGAFTREQAKGAIPNGTTIEKAKTEAGDGTPLGVRGVVLGSFSHPNVMGGAVLYFIEWANAPRRAVAVVDWKINPTS